MTSPETSTPFRLPDHLAAKAAPALIAADVRHFAAIESSIAHALTTLTERLDVVRQDTAGHGQAAMDRDAEVHRLSARLRVLRRHRLDLCLGRTTGEMGGTTYVGRVGLTDADGNRLLVDWRTPAAEPFFAATHAHPQGLVSRRRYRWTDGVITDYWDEVFSAEGLDGSVALDDQSAFIASLGSSRSAQMRDVLGTIAADQDAIIRAGSRGALVVDGGPGTGKTVVALHRAAYLLHADPRLGHRRGGVLVVGPHQPYLSYVADVLPSLGEDGVRTCTVRNLVPEGPDAGEEADPQVALLKQSARMVEAIEPAVRLYEEPPKEGMDVATPWVELWVGVADWAEAFGAVDPATPHNEARGEIRDALVEILLDKWRAEDPDPAEDGAVGDGVVGEGALRAALERHRGLAAAIADAWPILEPTDLVGDLWEVPAFLRHCAPWLAEEDVQRLRRPAPQTWTVADLPLLDAARRRLGDPQAWQRTRRHEAEVAAQRAEMDSVVEHLVADDDSEMKLMSMLTVSDAQSIIIDTDAVTDPTADDLRGPYAHVIVDEAQELTDAEWTMVLGRCPSRSLTIVGDRAQARHGFAESWVERLDRVGIDRVELASLSVNYRTPEEVMAEAEPVIRAALPDANVPASIRSSGVPVHRGSLAELPVLLADWRAEHAEGTACVVTTTPDALPLEVPPRVRVLTPELVKGLEFDLVVLLAPEGFGSGIEGAVDTYVAMTRATQRLVVLTSRHP